jgi:hypothetical protein
MIFEFSERFTNRAMLPARAKFHHFLIPPGLLPLNPAERTPARPRLTPKSPQGDFATPPVPAPAGRRGENGVMRDQHILIPITTILIAEFRPNRW